MDGQKCFKIGAPAPESAPGGSLKRSEHWFVFTFLTPILILFLLFNLLPILATIAISLFNYSPVSTTVPFVGLKNYLDLTKDLVFIKAFRNTIFFVAVTTGLNIIFSTAIAYTISRMTGWFKNLLRTLFFLPCIAPMVAAAIIWQLMLDPSFGIPNMVLSFFGIDRQIYLLTSEMWALPSIILITLWADLGYNIIIIMAGLDAIPKTYYEAAWIDGANKLQVFWNVTLPLLVRTMLFALVTSTIFYFQVFTQVQVISPYGDPNNATQVMALRMVNTAFTQNMLGYASAMAVLLLGIILIVSLAQIRLGKVDWEY